MSQENMQCKSSRKRKLMPLRNRNVDFLNDAGPSINLEPLAVETQAFPYGNGEQEKNRAKTSDIQQKAPPQLRTLVCTFMHSREVDFVREAVSKLGAGWEIEESVTMRTTHVVCGAEKRTLNLLKGIAYGCWVIRKEWVKVSFESGGWVKEDPYEIKSFPAVLECRIARQSGTNKVCNIFKNNDSYYVAKKTSPPFSELIILLQLCGGKVEESCKRANVIISSKALKLPEGKINVSELWVIESIAKNSLQETEKYLRHK